MFGGGGRGEGSKWENGGGINIPGALVQLEPSPPPPEASSDGIDNKRLMTIAEKSLSSTTQLISHEIH